MSRTKSQLPFSGPPLTPPAPLSEAQAKVFREIIGAVDAGHFNAVDLTLIIEYCRCTVACDEAARLPAAMTLRAAIVAIGVLDAAAGKRLGQVLRRNTGRDIGA